jgi:hypothetical protein
MDDRSRRDDGEMSLDHAGPRLNIVVEAHSLGACAVWHVVPEIIHVAPEARYVVPKALRVVPATALVVLAVARVVPRGLRVARPYPLALP